MNIRLLIICLFFISAIPLSISIYAGWNLSWLMVWKNEAILWGLGFSLFALLGIFLAYQNKEKYPKFYFFSCTIALVIVLPTIYDFFVLGWGASSKSDSTTLEMWEFWKSNWWK
ncbi:MAG: hypothetical protein PVJ72_11235 [Gammaproteobacteria bacterium]|jgi:hypothetical protein